MYAGRIVEAGTLEQIFYDPQHPYTWGLLGSLTRIDRPRTQPAAADHRPAAVADLARPRAATSAPAARTRSTAAPRCRALERRVPASRPPRPLLARAGAEAELRVVDGGEIGLEAPAA